MSNDFRLTLLISLVHIKPSILTSFRNNKNNDNIIILRTKSSAVQTSRQNVRKLCFMSHPNCQIFRVSRRGCWTCITIDRPFLFFLFLLCLKPSFLQLFYLSQILLSFMLFFLTLFTCGAIYGNSFIRV